MDLETENRVAALLMEEARSLRAEADKEGIHVYLRQPKVRGRPNSRFLTATVLGVQQANKIVEVNEMWCARKKELELDNKLVNISKDKGIYREICHDSPVKDSGTLKHDKARSSSLSSSSKHVYDHLHGDDGFADEEIDNFLHSRVKRGRGAVGSRMDEPSPHPVHAPSNNGEDMPDIRIREGWEQRVLRVEKPLLSRSQKYVDHVISSKTEKEKSSSSKKKHGYKKHQKEKSERKKRKEGRSRHRHKSP